jgi:hypothetical protein
MLADDLMSRKRLLEHIPHHSAVKGSYFKSCAVHMTILAMSSILRNHCFTASFGEVQNICLSLEDVQSRKLN